MMARADTGKKRWDRNIVIQKAGRGCYILMGTVDRDRNIVIQTAGRGSYILIETVGTDLNTAAEIVGMVLRNLTAEELRDLHIVKSDRMTVSIVLARMAQRSGGPTRPWRLAKGGNSLQRQSALKPRRWRL